MLTAGVICAALNYLTPDLILAATKEIKTGISIQLDLSLNHFDHLGAGRQGFNHQIIDFKERLKGTDLEIVAHDDVLTLNTQSSSQWDGLRHIGLQESGTYYSGVKHRDIDEKREDGKLGIHSKFPHRNHQEHQILTNLLSQSGLKEEALSDAESFSITVDGASRLDSLPLSSSRILRSR
jgi:hypothetical protein